MAGASAGEAAAMAAAAEEAAAVEGVSVVPGRDTRALTVSSTFRSYVLVPRERSADYEKRRTKYIKHPHNPESARMKEQNYYLQFEMERN